MNSFWGKKWIYIYHLITNMPFALKVLPSQSMSNTRMAPKLGPVVQNSFSLPSLIPLPNSLLTAHCHTEIPKCLFMYRQLDLLKTSKFWLLFSGNTINEVTVH